MKRNIVSFFSLIDKVIHKLPIRLKHLILIALNSSISARKFFKAMLVTYWAALRISEMLRLTWSDIEFRKDCICLTVTRGKNHVEPRHCILPRLPVSHAAVCPYRCLVRLRQAAKKKSKKLFVFSAKRFRDFINAAMAPIEDGHFTPHSLRAGFCTDAHASSLPAAQIDMHCRWSSASSYLSYYQPDVQDRVQFGRSLSSSLCANLI